MTPPDIVPASDEIIRELSGSTRCESFSEPYSP